MSDDRAARAMANRFLEGDSIHVIALDLALPTHYVEGCLRWALVAKELDGETVLEERPGFPSMEDQLREAGREWVDKFAQGSIGPAETQQAAARFQLGLREKP